MTLSAATTLLQSRGSTLLRCLNQSTAHQLPQWRSISKMVRVIVTKDLPNGKAYQGEVIQVRPGHARNLLIPKKLAIYAIPENFERLGMKDPDSESAEEKRARLELEQQAEEEGGEDLKAADILKHYLRNKVLKIRRNVDANTGQVHPGWVTAHNIRDKLGKQLKIDLEDHEMVHMRAAPMPGRDDMSEEEIEKLMEDIPTEEKCELKIKQLGNFIAKISLAGGHVVPLKFTVVPR